MKRPKLPKISNLVNRHQLAIDEVVHETTSGGVVFRRNQKTQQLEIMLLQDAKNRWTIPKGHVEPDEDPKVTAEREIIEETGLKSMKVYDWLGKVDFRYRRSHTLVLMTMHIYLVHGLGQTDELNPEEWLNDLRWLSVNEAIDKIAYADISKLMLKGIKKIRDAKLF